MCVCVCGTVVDRVKEKNVCVSSPKSSVVQCGVSIFVLDLDGAVGLQQGLHHLHVALVGSNLQSRFALVFNINLSGTQPGFEDSLEATAAQTRTELSIRLAGNNLGKSDNHVCHTLDT